MILTCEPCARYQTFEDAMAVCRGLGDANSYLTPFDDYQVYDYFLRQGQGCSSSGTQERAGEQSSGAVL